MSELNPWLMWALPTPWAILGRVLAAIRGWRDPFGPALSIEGDDAPRAAFATLLVLVALFCAFANEPWTRWERLTWTATMLKLRAAAAWRAAVGRKWA